MSSSGFLPGQRLRIVHRTGYQYDGAVAASYNEARMTPTTTLSQTALEATLEIGPVTWRSAYWDYWGTQVTAFEVLQPHQQLSVVSSSLVECGPIVPAEVDDTWDALRDERACDPLTEFLIQTPNTEPVPELVALARQVADGAGPDQAARAVIGAIRDRMDYVPGSTAVTTTAAEAWIANTGVCQDFAHISIGALRSIGLPARYVSGYRHPRPDAAIGQTVEGDSHAWVEWWCGDWVSFDPTSLEPAGVDHVVVAKGRDYADVVPLKGVYAGPSGSRLYVSVEVTRLA